jgi:hypothetical protein
LVYSFNPFDCLEHCKYQLQEERLLSKLIEDKAKDAIKAPGVGT